MVKRLLSFLISLVFVAPLAYAQEAEEEYADQSEIVTVLNETDEDGNYIVGRSEDGYPTVTFRFTVPEEVENFKIFGMESTYPSARNGYYFLYYQQNYASYLQNAFVQATVLADEDDYSKSVYYSGSASCSASEDESGRTVHDFTLVISSKFDNRHCCFGNFKVRLPKVAIFLTGNELYEKQYAAATYKFVSDGTISGDVKSSELTNVGETSNIYLKAGSTLNVDGDLVCKNVYVEAADESAKGLPAGIVINEGASLIADSIFFMANEVDERSVGYLINNGTLSAGVAFLKNAMNGRTLDVAYATEYGYVQNGNVSKIDDRWSISLSTFSSPVQSQTGWVDMNNQKVKSGKVYVTGLWTPFLLNGDYPSDSGLANLTDWSGYYEAESSIPFYLQHLYVTGENVSRSVRVVGEINDQDSYALPVTNLAAIGQDSQYFISNPYSAPVDWRSVVEADSEDKIVSDIRDMQFSFYSPSVYSIYNFKTGLTTTDAADKMYYGYLQPNMTHVSLLHNAGEVESIIFAKSDLLSYQQADEKYAGKDITNGLPYIRFYVDDTNSDIAKGKGNRSVVAIYFVSQEQFDELHSTENADYDATYDVNNVWESLADTHVNSVEGLKNSTGWLFPYVGAYGVSQTSDDVATAIKMVAIPEKGEESAASADQDVEAETILNNFIRISIDAKHAADEGSVEFGVLDYDLKDAKIGVKVGGLSLSYPGTTADVTSTTISVADGYTEGEVTNAFEADKKYSEWDCKQLSLNLTVAKAAEKPEAIKTNTAGVSVYANGGAVVVSTSEAGVLRVYDLTGRLVTEKSVGVGSASVAMPAGVYVASFEAESTSCVKSVIVK